MVRIRSHGSDPSMQWFRPLDGSRSFPHRRGTYHVLGTYRTRSGSSSSPAPADHPRTAILTHRFSCPSHRLGTHSSCLSHCAHHAIELAPAVPPSPAPAASSRTREQLTGIPPVPPLSQPLMPLVSPRHPCRPPQPPHSSHSTNQVTITPRPWTLASGRLCPP
jgi:hypothetical protein